MGKTKEQKARAALALKEKRHRLKAEAKAKAALDRTAEVACEDCRKHIAAVLAAHEDAKHLKDHVRTLKTQMEEQDVRWSKIERDQAVYDCEVAPLREKLKEAEYQLKVQEKNHEAEVLELKLEHAQQISEWKQRLALAMAWTGQIPKPAKEENIFVDPSDSPSRSPKKKKKKKGKWGGDRRSAAAREKQAEQKKQQQRA